MKGDGLSGRRNDLLGIAAGVAIRNFPGVPTAAMERLMRVAGEVQNPGEIIGANVV